MRSTRNILLVSYIASNATVEHAKADISAKLEEEKKSGNASMDTLISNLPSFNIVNQQSMLRLEARISLWWQETTPNGDDERSVRRCTSEMKTQT